MQTLVFNTTERTVIVYAGTAQESLISYTFSSIPTVKPREGYYEIIQKEFKDDGSESNVPIARFPISNTNMLIQK